MSAIEDLVDGLFDYAGMFAPASLPFEAALRESARAPRLGRPHMVGTEFVARLGDLGRLTHASAQAAGFGDAEVKVAVVGLDDTALEQAAAEVTGWNRFDPRIRVASLEPTSAKPTLTDWASTAAALGPVRLYIEPEWAPTGWKHLDSLLDVLVGLRDEVLPQTVGLKVRCAGARAVPVPALAQIVADVTRLGLPLKLTQGLHHPIVESRYQNRLGFIGIAMAHALADQLDANAMQAVMTESDASAFAFEAAASWRGFDVARNAIRERRRQAPLAIGSCSLTEPDSDLTRLWGPPKRP